MKRRSNREGSIYPRPNGTWSALISVEGHRLSFTAKTRRECVDWVRQTQEQLDNGMTYASARRSLTEYLQGWLASEKASMRPATYKHYRQLINSYVIPNLGSIKLMDLRTGHIQDLYTLLISQQVGAYTIHKIHTLLQGSLKLAVETGVIKRNPASSAHPPKKPASEMRFFDESQASAFLVAVAGHRWEALFQLAIVTGLRQMELLGLRWLDVDWIRQTVKVERQLDRPDGTGVSFSDPKTARGKRTIALGEKTIQVLRDHYNRQQVERITAGEKWTEYGLVFTNSLGGPINPRNLLRTFYQVLKSAGLLRIRFHDLRHTAASLMLNNNVPVIVVSQRLGHSKVSTTVDVYAHLIPTMQAEAAQLIDELVTPVPLQPNCNQIAAKLQQDIPLNPQTPEI